MKITEAEVTVVQLEGRDAASKLTLRHVAVDGWFIGYSELYVPRDALSRFHIGQRIQVTVEAVE